MNVIWNNTLTQIKEELASLTFNTWFNDTKLNKIDNDIAFIIVPMPIHKRHLQENYYNLISDKMFEVTGTQYDLEFLLEEEIEKIEEDKEQKVKKENNDNSNVNSNSILVSYCSITNKDGRYGG